MVIALFGFATWAKYKPISALMWSFIFALSLVTSASVWFEVRIGAINALVIITFSFLASITLGRRLGLSNRLAILIGVGTSICGASAIAATAPAIQAKEEEIRIAISGITLFGLISMFLYPYLFTNTVVYNCARAGVGSKVKFRDIAKVGMRSFAFAAIMSIMAGVLALGMAILIAPYVA